MNNRTLIKQAILNELHAKDMMSKQAGYMGDLTGKGLNYLRGAKWEKAVTEMLKARGRLGEGVKMSAYLGKTLKARNAAAMDRLLVPGLVAGGTLGLGAAGLGGYDMYQDAQEEMLLAQAAQEREERGMLGRAYDDSSDYISDLFGGDKVAAYNYDMMKYAEETATAEAILQASNIAQNNMAQVNADTLQALAALEAGEGEIPPELLAQMQQEEAMAAQGGMPQGGMPQGEIPPEVLAQMAQEQAMAAQQPQAVPAEQKVAQAYYDILSTLN